MAQYQKILQLYRTTNIWNTKNIAKAEVEIHAKLLHEELEAQLRDGEPIVAKYYDEPESGYTYSYTSLSSKDPYQGTNSSLHYWVDGVDKFNSNEVTISGDTLTAIKGAAPSYDSPAYVWVVNGSKNSYFKLNVEVTGSPSRGESAVFGIALTVDDTNNIFTIEWFDSESEAKGAISDINYEDHDLENGFVAKVNQKDGKIESIHGTISAEKAIAVTQDAYTYVKLDNSRTIPSDYIWDEYDEGADLPEEINENSPKYYHVTTGDNAGYYELRKNIDITLTIDNTQDTGDPNVLSQSDAGLKVNLNLRQLTQTEINALPNGVNVKEAYKLVGNAGSTEKQIGETIKVYKDSSLYKVYLGETSDTLTDVYAWRQTDGQNVVYTVDGLVDDDAHDIVREGSKTYNKVANEDRYTESDITVSAFNSESKTITVESVNYEYIGSATPWIENGSGGSEALCFVYYLANDDYELVAVNLEDFLQESEFGDGLKVNDHVVSVKLDSDGGIEFKTEQTGNKSLKINIDSTNTNEYYRLATDSELRDASVQKYSYKGESYWVDNSTSFSALPQEVTAESKDYIRVGNEDTGWTYYQKNENDGVYSYEPIKYDLGEYLPDANGKYVRDTYFHTTTKGLAIDQAVLENKITDNVGKVLYVNGEQFVKDGNGNITAVVTGNDIKVAGAGSTIPNVDKTEIYGDTNQWSYIATPVSDSPEHIITGVNDIMTLRYRSNGGSEYINYPQQSSHEYIEANGLIFKWNTTNAAYELFFIDKDTNLNDAISIVEYLVYNLDMGMFTI
jgi:hypothetical protein